MFRGFAAAVALAAIAMSPIARAENAADRLCTRDTAPYAWALRANMAALFAPVDRESQIVRTASGLTAPMGPVEVIMVRIAPDGKPILGCVNSEDEARRFLTAPLTELSARVKEK